jgi:hypothetical protein
MSKTTQLRQQIFTAPKAAENDDVHAAITLPASGTTVVTTAITNPDVPRVMRIKGNAAGITGNVVIEGTDIQGNTITDTIVAVDDTAVDGVKAFATVTKITVPARTTSGDTISVGLGAKLGLECICDAYSFTGFAGVSSYAYDASDISKNVVTPSATLNGSTTIALIYIPATFPAYGRSWG